VVLVPFLLSTAVFTRLSVIDLSLPAKNSGVEQVKDKNLQLEVVMRPDALEVGDRIGGLIARIPNTAKGYDTVALSTLIQGLKAQFPDKTEASVLAEPNSSYDALVQVMDAVRVVATPKGAVVVHTEMFPNISIGDAPVVKR
jgi:biopolymer transport protein ExbD